MSLLFLLSRGIDRLNKSVAVLAILAVLACSLISAGNASIRYLFSVNSILGIGSNGWLEMQWYLFAVMVMLGGPYTLCVNEHVRVDLFYGSVAEKTRTWIDLLGGLLFLLPMCVLLIYFTLPWAIVSYRTHELSTNAGGLPMWPVKIMLPIGFSLLALQGLSEIIKCVSYLTGGPLREHAYEKPVQ